MPETRYIETYDSQGNLISSEAYEVDDDQLAREQDLARLTEILDNPPPLITPPLTGEALVILTRILDLPV